MADSGYLKIKVPTYDTAPSGLAIKIVYQGKHIWLPKSSISIVTDKDGFEIEIPKRLAEQKEIEF